jgi:hypothetical protein
MVSARLLARLAHLVRRIGPLHLKSPAQARRLRLALLVLVRVSLYRDQSNRATYLSRHVRNRGIWRNWCDAGLQHLDDRAMIRFCLFPKSVVYEIANGIVSFPEMASLRRDSRYFRRSNELLRPSCDVLDVVVLVLREIATIGYQHQLEADMGLHRGVIGKYLVRGKAAMRKFLFAHPASRMGLLSKELGEAAFSSLENQHGPCPRAGLVLPYFQDGFFLPSKKPSDPILEARYYSANKKCSGTNNVLLHTNLGSISGYRIGLPGTINDSRAAEPLMEMLFDPAENPHNHGCIVDYGYCTYCHVDPALPPIVRPYQPTKDPFIENPTLRAHAGEFSRWVCSCRQCNEWVNGSAKRGFPRMNMRIDLRFLSRLITDMELYMHLYNFRVRMTNWSECRSVYFEHAMGLFAAQGLVYDDVHGIFDPVEPVVPHPDE